MSIQPIPIDHARARLLNRMMYCHHCGRMHPAKLLGHGLGSTAVYQCGIKGCAKQITIVPMHSHHGFGQPVLAARYE